MNGNGRCSCISPVTPSQASGRHVEARTVQRAHVASHVQRRPVHAR